MFTQHQSFTKAAIGQPMSLGRGHIDPAIITLTFHYEELVPTNGVWITEPKAQVLEEGTHYSLNARGGQITLLDHPFWQQEGHWRVGDREEPLLYKGRVKHPQRIEFSYEYYAPEEIALPTKVKTRGTVKIFREAGQLRMVDFAEVNQGALARLGYEVPRYAEAAA